MTSDREAWASFWKSGGDGGCLPCAQGAVEEAQRACWEAFAQRLPRGARVLDLGTGNGVVLVRMGRVRPDLKLTGVDASPYLPPAPKGVSLRAGVPIEKLPFAAAGFDAVTAQFGYEYADTALAAREVARVLKPGGIFQLMIHRRDGPILAHNLARREALDWALAPGGWLDKARALAAARAFALIPTPPAFRQAPQEARQRFPRQSVATEIMLAMLQALDPPMTANASLAALASLDRKARGEMARIAELDNAARDEAGIGQLIEELRGFGLAVDSPSLLEDRQGQGFAWLVSGSRNPG